MKSMRCVLLVALMLGSTCRIDAYTFSFINKTNENLYVRIKLSPSVFENWFAPQKVARWGGTAVFKVGGRKIGFCLSKIQYSYDNVMWEAAAVEWVEGEAGARFDRALQIVGAVADVVTDVGQQVLYTIDAEALQKLRAIQNQVAPYVRNLSNVLNMSATDLESLTRAEVEKQITERFIQPHMAHIAAGDPATLAQLKEVHTMVDTLFLKDIHLDAHVEAQKISQSVDTAATQVLATGKSALQSGVSLATNLVDVRMSEVITAVGTLIKYSWCKSLEFEIVKNEDKKIKFLVQVGQ